MGPESKESQFRRIQSRSSHTLGDPFSLFCYLIMGNLIDIYNEALVLGKKKKEEEDSSVLDFLIRVRTVTGDFLYSKFVE